MTKAILPALAPAAAALAGNSLFNLLGGNFIEALLAVGQHLALIDGETLFRQGDPGDSAFILLSGSLDVMLDIGTEQVRMALLDAPQLVGEIAVFADQPRIATVAARGATSLLRLPRQEFLRLVGASPAAAQAIIADLGRRLATVNTPLAFLSTASQLLRNDRVDGDTLAAMAKDMGGLGPFAATFGMMVSEIKAKQERQQDMAMARRIQDSVLPKQLALPPGLVAIAAMIRPMKEVGGDLYDYFMVDQTHLAFAVADVSGKGVPASLFMMMFHTVLRAVSSKDLGPHEVLARANALLAEDNDACMFVTAFFALLDLESGLLSYVNAGHNPPYCLGREGDIQALDAEGMAVGILPGARYQPRTLQMRRGDRLFLFSDGVTEAFSPAHEQFGESRLEALLIASRSLPVYPLVASVVEAIDLFADGREQSDDITCLALDFRPAG